MSNLVQILTKIEARDDDALDKHIYVFLDNECSQKKFENLVKETVVNLSYDYLDYIDDPEEEELSYLLEELDNKGHYTILHDSYFYFNHKDSIREIEIDLESYFARSY